MCLICSSLAADKLTALEARNNLKEMIEIIEKDHRLEVLKMIWEKEDEEYIHWYNDSRYGDTD